MELLAQCSQVLYNEDLLDAKRYISKLEQKKSILVVPRIPYKNKEEWSQAVNKFCKTIKEFIFNNNFPLNIQFTSLYFSNAAFDEINNIYLYELNILTKHQCLKWCKNKTDSLIQLIKLSYRALCSVRKSGYGSFPFMNWRPKEYHHFIWNIIYQFETNHDRYKYDAECGWIGHIPYYHCSACGNGIEGIFKGSPIIANYYYTDMEQLCLLCIKKNIKQIISFQALWRGYLSRNFTL